MFLFVTVMAIEALLGMKSLEWLSDQPEDASSLLPSLSLIVAARNEEKNIRAGVLSLLRLDYPDKEIIVVNDRSTDQTGAILKELASQEPRLRIITITELPKGWLGKNYALWSGAAAASGNLFLFTDADVVMDKSVLRRAVPFFEKNQLDHLAIGPKAVMPGMLLNIFMAGFGVFFNMYARPWRVKNPKSSAHIGIGAFNLLRAEAYDKIGTHQAIAMRPDDDLKLGKLIKKHGLRQNFLLGTDLIFVEWYDSVKALINGLMKNSFAGMEYSLPLVITGTSALLFFGVGPFVALFFTTGVPQLLFLTMALIMLGVGSLSARAQGLHWVYGLGFPLACLVFFYILWKATLRTLLRGGIEWRGTFYSLEELRKNVV